MGAPCFSTTSCELIMHTSKYILYICWELEKMIYIFTTYSCFYRLGAVLHQLAGGVVTGGVVTGGDPTNEGMFHHMDGII